MLLFIYLQSGYCNTSYIAKALAGSVLCRPAIVHSVENMEVYDVETMLVLTVAQGCKLRRTAEQRFRWYNLVLKAMH